MCIGGAFLRCFKIAFALSRLVSGFASFDIGMAMGMGIGMGMGMAGGAMIPLVCFCSAFLF